MALPEFGRVLFKKAPLTKVIGQVRFPILLRFSDGTFIAPFHESVRREYPHVSREHQMSLKLSAGEGVQTSVGEVLWRFATPDRRWSVVLGETAITLEVPGYSSIDEFLARFSSIIAAAQPTLELAQRTRLGLRYINEIRYPNGDTLADWASLLRPEFVGFAASDLLDGRVEDMRQELRVHRDDGILAVRHGLVGVSDALASGQPTTVERFYLIDLDYFDPTECDLDIETTVGQMRSYNDVMYRFFRWTLGERLYDYLEPADAS
jgi:uncharacterized protein (TIGR04255 family)